MCTAVSLNGKDHYFGRTLDLHCSYGEKVCVTPRNFPFRFRKMGQMSSHYALIGMAMVAGDVPLYYDAANEKGLCMAGLNFPGNAYYFPETEGKDNVTPFEFIPWILCRCATVKEAKKLLERINLVDILFSEQWPLSPLHWIIRDAREGVIVESTKDGLNVYEDAVGVMTNNPPYPFHLMNLNNYRGLQVNTPENRFCPELSMDVYCQGLGAMGLPGDVSSMSRFVRAAFGVKNAVCEETENSAVSQFFHLMDFVSMVRGICLTDEGHWDITVYTGCINATRGLYYCSTYDNRQISCVDMHKTDLDGRELTVYEVEKNQQVHYL